MYLNNHSVYSFRYGTLSLAQLLELAKRNNQRQLALTDINNTSACLNFVREALCCGIKPLIGVDFRNGARQQFVALAKSNRGFHHLNSYLSDFLHRRASIPDRAAHLEEVAVIYPFEKFKNQFVELSADEFMGISIQQLKSLSFSPWRSHQHKFVLLQTVSFSSKRDYNIHRLMRAIDKNVLLSKLHPEELASADHQMVTDSVIEQALKDFPEIQQNTQRLVEEVSIRFTYKESRKSGSVNHNKQHFTASKLKDQELIRSLCKQGLAYRYPEAERQRVAEVRMQKELKLIHEQNFESYFLINWDLLRFAREQGYFYVGRGSGANSIVAYLLQITDVDPVKLDLYFERFINPYRENPPDFDIDFSWKDRDEVTRYLFQKYGKLGQIALLATYNTFTYRSLVRELGKVFGLPKRELDRLATERRQEENPDEYVRLIYKYAAYMNGIPSHLSVHAGGVIISEKPIHYYSATNLPPKGYPTVQFDMVHAEDAGLYKFDILSQRGLGKIKETVDLVIQSGKEPQLDIHQTERFFEDKKIKDLLRNADTMGCFYIESPAMRMLLKKLKVDSYLGLVAASSIIRPGVAKSGMMREYILRSQTNENHWKKTTPKIMQELMKETYGVMVYQEDVIKVAHYFAGLSLGEADLLRRGMSGKFRSRVEFAKVKQQFFANCEQKGYSMELTSEVWRQTESFAGYAFSKGHSASYAIESYQSLYLKAYYPMEFILGVLNNGGGFYSTEMYLHEARQMGAKVEAPCINQSHYLSVLRGEQCIFLGFSLIRDLDQKVVQELLSQRAENGKFLGLADFVDRCFISKEQLILLIRAGAFRFTMKSKQELLWEVYQLPGKEKKVVATPRLFSPISRQVELPDLDQLKHEAAFDQMELFGFPLCSPFDLLEHQPEEISFAKDLPQQQNKIVQLVGYLVCIKNTRTTQGKRMQFGTFVDQRGDWIDTVHFPKIVSQQPFQGKACYLLKGKVNIEFGYPTLAVTSMKRLNFLRNGREC